MTDCIFCKIVNKEMPANVVYEDDVVLAFRDIKPVSPYHVLLIPKRHSDNILKLQKNEILSVFSVVKKLAEEENLEESGFRLVNNNGFDGGQEVGHVHFHMLGKRQHKWPPG